MIIDGINVTCEGFSYDDAPDRKELSAYVKYVTERVQNVDRLNVKLCSDGEIDLNYFAHNQKFERIRRITGYLVGTIDRWNDAKQSEEQDRVKHDTRSVS